MTTGNQNDAFMKASANGYYTKIQWEAVPKWELWDDAWWPLRERFTALRQGDFSAIDDLLQIRLTLENPAAQQFVENLLGDAGTDRHLKEVEEFVLNEVVQINVVENLCKSLCLWGRLSCVGTLITVFDRFFDSGFAEKIPSYLSSLLEPELGAAWQDPPRDCEDEKYYEYLSTVNELWECRKNQLGHNSYALWGAQFSVEALARRQLILNDHRLHTNILRRDVRHRFEASTGINCSSFFKNGKPQPLTAAAMAEEWLESDAPSKFVLGERYFFGHRIPRG